MIAMEKERKLLPQISLIKLVGPKTINSKRSIIMCEPLKHHLYEKKRKRDEDEIRFAVGVLSFIDICADRCPRACKLIDQI